MCTERPIRKLQVPKLHNIAVLASGSCQDMSLKPKSDLAIDLVSKMIHHSRGLILIIMIPVCISCACNPVPITVSAFQKSLLQQKLAQQHRFLNVQNHDTCKVSHSRTAAAGRTEGHSSRCCGRLLLEVTTTLMPASPQHQRIQPAPKSAT